jgi:hypothetical protein
MQTIKYQIGLVNLNSVDSIVETLNNLPDVNCTIEEKKITSAVLSISIDDNCTSEDILALGSLIGIVQASRL